MLIFESTPGENRTRIVLEPDILSIELTGAFAIVRK